MTAGFRIEKLRRNHPLDGFSSDREALDRFLLRYAFANQPANVSQIYLGLHDDEVIGFYTLVVSEVATDQGTRLQPQRRHALLRLGERT